jgi:hypothetical protein
MLLLWISVLVFRSRWLLEEDKDRCLGDTREREGEDVEI